MNDLPSCEFNVLQKEGESDFYSNTVTYILRWGFFIKAILTIVWEVPVKIYDIAPNETRRWTIWKWQMPTLRAHEFH